MDKLNADLLNLDSIKCFREARAREETARELAYLCQALEAKLPPPDADTSFFGYVLADDALHEWQRHGRKTEKEAKAKRKREKEASGEGMGRKKAKLA